MCISHSLHYVNVLSFISHQNDFGICSSCMFPPGQDILTSLLHVTCHRNCIRLGYEGGGGKRYFCWGFTAFFWFNLFCTATLSILWASILALISFCYVEWFQKSDRSLWLSLSPGQSHEVRILLTYWRHWRQFCLLSFSPSFCSCTRQHENKAQLGAHQKAHRKGILFSRGLQYSSGFSRTFSGSFSLLLDQTGNDR